ARALPTRGDPSRRSRPRLRPRALRTRVRVNASGPGTGPSPARGGVADGAAHQCLKPWMRAQRIVSGPWVHAVVAELPSVAQRPASLHPAQRRLDLTEHCMTTDVHAPGARRGHERNAAALDIRRET